MNACGFGLAFCWCIAASGVNSQYFFLTKEFKPIQKVDTAQERDAKPVPKTPKHMKSIYYLSLPTPGIHSMAERKIQGPWTHAKMGLNFAVTIY